MVMQYKGQKFMTDNDLQVNVLGVDPQIRIKNPELLETFQNELGRDFLGGDEIVSYVQPLVARGLKFSEIEEQILKDVQDPDKPKLKELVYRKTATGIGRGHSLGGLPSVTLGIQGSKFIDSGLTGLVASRSLVTSSRRRETTSEEIVVPEVLFEKEDLLEEYLELSRSVLNLSKEFKERFRRLDAVQTFNKMIPYNNPADLMIKLPLDTMVTLAFNVMRDKNNSKENFVPRELHSLVDMFPDLAEKAGMGTMYEQRVRVPRDAYFHYTLFKDPERGSDALEEALSLGMPLTPFIVDSAVNFNPKAQKELERIKQMMDNVMKINDPEELSKKSMEYMLELGGFAEEFNEAVRVKIVDSLSWRVWSEQKRHATLRQNVESVYSAVNRASDKMTELWSSIDEIYQQHTEESPANFTNMLDELREIMIIDRRMEKTPNLLAPYIYYTGKQLRFFDKMKEKGIEQRDALFIVPKNIRVRTMEHYDLTNLINLELPLRLCKECEPEREYTSWQKRDIIAKVAPELDPLLFPKCGVGFCTEKNFCVYLTEKRGADYKAIHKATKQVMLGKDE